MSLKILSFSCVILVLVSCIHAAGKDKNFKTDIVQVFSEDAIVTTTTGVVRGNRKETAYGHSYYYFDGIPYAKPPLGELRFREPEPVEKWSGIKNCTQSHSKSLQWNRRINEVQGSEDCLYLNVNVKRFNTKQRLPVMVYIHGGGYNTGDASRHAWGPDYFMMKDVVFITVSYRLGILGFASFSDKNVRAPGNCGIKDTVLALKWIQANCTSFNGDPENVTLFGHSSGGCVVNILMQTPSTKGLFHKTILMGGFNMSLPTEPKLEYRLAKHLGYEGKEGDEIAIYEFLCQSDATNFVNLNIFTEEETRFFTDLQIFPFCPRMESYVNKSTIICQDPVIAQRASWTNKVPVMVGCTSMEGLLNLPTYKYKPDIYSTYKKYPKSIVPPNLHSIGDEILLADIGRKLKKLHFGERELSSENYKCGVEIISYNTYHNQHRLIQSRQKYASAPTYVYRFDFDSPTYNFYRIRYCGPDVRGVGHADELCYLFSLPDSYKLETDSPEYKCILQMIDIFYSFAKSSNPSTGQLHWQPIECNGVPKCLNIGNDGAFVINMPEYEKCCARDKIYQMANVELF